MSTRPASERREPRALPQSHPRLEDQLFTTWTSRMLPNPLLSARNIQMYLIFLVVLIALSLKQIPPPWLPRMSPPLPCRPHMPPSRGKLPVPRLLLTGAQGSAPAAVRPGKKVLFLLFPRPRKMMSSPPRCRLHVTPQLQQLHLPLPIRPLPSSTMVVSRAKGSTLFGHFLLQSTPDPPPWALPTTRSGPLGLTFHPAPMRMPLPPLRPRRRMSSHTNYSQETSS